MGYRSAYNRCCNSIVSTCQPYKLQRASIVHMATYGTMLQVYKSARYLLVEKCLCIVQASSFLLPSLTIKHTIPEKISNATGFS